MLMERSRNKSSTSTSAYAIAVSLKRAYLSVPQLLGMESTESKDRVSDVVEHNEVDQHREVVSDHIPDLIELVR
jgi:hypothetical protein